MSQIKWHENKFQANNGGELTGGNKSEVILMASWLAVVGVMSMKYSGHIKLTTSFSYSFLHAARLLH